MADTPIPATQYIKFFYDVDNIMKEIDDKFQPVNSALNAKGSEWVGLKYMRRWNPFRWVIQNADTNTPAKLGLPLELNNDFIILSQAATKSLQIFGKDNEPVTISGEGQNTYIGFKQEFYDNNIKKFIEKVSRYYYLYFDSPNGCRCFYGRLRPQKVEDDILNSGTGVNCDEPRNKYPNDPKSKFFPLYTFNELISCSDRLYKCSVNSKGGWKFAGDDEYNDYVFIKLDESDEGPFCDRQNIANNSSINVSESTISDTQKYSTNMSIGPLGPISYSLYKNENNTNAVKEIKVDNNSDICFKDGDLYCCSRSEPGLDEDLTYVGYVLKPRSGMKTLMTIAPESKDSFFMDLIAKFFAGSVYNNNSNYVEIYIPGSGFAYVSYTAEVFMSFSRNLFEFSNVFCRGTTSGYTKLWCHQIGTTSEPPYEPICGLDLCETTTCNATMPVGKVTVIRFTTNLDNTTNLITNPATYNNYECNTVIGGSCTQTCGNCIKKSEIEEGTTVDPSGTLIDLSDPCGCDEPTFKCEYSYGDIASKTDVVIFPIHISLATSSRTLDIKSSLFSVYLVSLTNALNLLNNSLTNINPKMSVPPVGIQPFNNLEDYFSYRSSVLFGNSEPYTSLPTLGDFSTNLIYFLDSTTGTTSNTIKVAYELGCGNNANNYKELFFKEQVDNCEFITLYANRNLKYHATDLSDFVPAVDTNKYSWTCKLTTRSINLGDIDQLDYVKTSDFEPCNKIDNNGSGCETCSFEGGGKSNTPPGHDDSGGDISGKEEGEEQNNPDTPGYKPSSQDSVPDACSEAYNSAKTEAENIAKQWYDGRYISVQKKSEETMITKIEDKCYGDCYAPDEYGNPKLTTCTYSNGTLDDGLCCTHRVTITTTYKQSCWATSGWQANKWYWKQGSGAGGILKYELTPAHEVYRSFTQGPLSYSGSNTIDAGETSCG